MSLTDSKVIEPSIYDAEKRRRWAIARNAAFVASLGKIEPEQKIQDSRRVKKKSEIKEEAQPQRRSRRIASIKPEFDEYVQKPLREKSYETKYSQPSSAELAKATNDDGTASRSHCLHRIRTMSDQALRKRIKVIERAHGKYCVSKMAIFEEVLKDEGKTDLADEAHDALLRLTRGDMV